ncbi:hypothetical protein B0H21DRAFT_860177 [Amylocystis lapponica]|nr:hypothetical protein B0H21DRAFT_860177 [Amylocystis lapponica]
MAVLSLPLTFQNSFWTQDYRKGLEVLYGQLEKGVAENKEVVAFIKSRAAAEAAIAASLVSPPSGPAFAHDEGASLHISFRGLKEEAIAQGKVHEAVAQELQTQVAEPFEKWAGGFKERLLHSKHNVLDGWMQSYEYAQGDVVDLKGDYLTKTRKADEAEDDARFAPITQNDKFTSPNLGPRDLRVPPRVPTRQPTMSERITQRFKELRLGAQHPLPDDTKPEVHFDADAEEKGTPKVDKGKGRAVDTASPPAIASPPPMSPPLPPARLATNPVPLPPAPPLSVAGLMLPPAEVSALLTRAKSGMNLRPVRFPVLGEYQDAFSGEEFATWLKDNVKEFEGNLDRAAFGAKELTQKHNLLRRIGELGNDFENVDDAYYQFRAKAFNLEEVPVKEQAAISPIQKTLSPFAENVAVRTNNLAALVTKAFNANGVAEPIHVKARREADIADQEYRVAVRKLDRQRLALEERIEETLKTLQKWEFDRLRALKTVLRQYHDVLAKLSKAYGPSVEHSETLITMYQPEADIKVLIERHRTGPFRPEPQVYESVTHDEPDVVFGIDLRRWAESGSWNSSVGSPEKKEEIPPVLTVLLAALSEAYGKLPSELERRKTWIYDVPLPAVHHLRETLNAVPPEQSLPNDILTKYDAPVLAGAIKLWALELDPPLGMYESWDELRKLYPTVGSAANGEEPPSEEQHIQDVQLALQKLPKIHLLVLDTIVKHLKDLVDSTAAAETEESNEVYITKLALTMGRTILRPKQENEFSIQDRHPTLLFIDLLNKYTLILPPTLSKKKRESERKMPVRRRTRPVDMRMSRSRITPGADLRELQSQQFVQRTGLKNTVSPPPMRAGTPLAPVPGSPNPTPETLTQTAELSLPEAPIMVTTEPESMDESPLPRIPKAVPDKDDIHIQDNRSFASIPPPPPLQVPVVEAPVAPAHPVFKEPPPETDDLPPRPSFKEPPPEPVSPPPMPSFVEPPSEPSFSPPPVEVDVSPPATAIPASLRAGSIHNGRSPSPRARAPSSASATSRSPSPTKPASPPASSADSSRLRGPRLARAPRAGGGGAVGSMVSNLNRQSIGSRPASPGSPGVGASLSRAGSRTYGAHAKRSSISRVTEFSRRTMASDAEDEVVEK